MTFAIRVHEFGGPEQLLWEEIPLRELRDGEARVRHTAIGLNFVETGQRRGLMRIRRPFIPGNAAAGIVEEIAGDAPHARVGDRVAYAPVMGSYAEMRNIPTWRLVKLPDTITDQDAAAIMLQGMTAQYLLRELHRVGPDDIILVQAAAGGVGLCLCQWASSLGATVIGTVSTPRKAEIAKAHGCHHTILYSTENVPDRVKEITSGRMATVVYDAVGPDTIEGSFKSLRRLGRVISYGNSSGPLPPIDISALGNMGSLSITRGTLMTFSETREDLERCAGDLFAAMAAGHLKANIFQTFPLREASEAHRSLEGRATVGLSVLLP